MRILFIGSKNRGALCLQAIVEAGFNVVGVLTPMRDDPYAFWTVSVADTAGELGLEHHGISDINDYRAVVTSFHPDLIILCGYNIILGKPILDIPTIGTINLHAGKIPEYRGGSPMNWAIINGETWGYCTIHEAVEKVDAGPIWAEAPFVIEPTDTIHDVRLKSLAIFPPLLVGTLNELKSGELDPKPVDISCGTYWGSRKPQDGRIEWWSTAVEVYDFIRALTHPYPGAFTYYKGNKLYVWEAHLMEGRVEHTPGRICMAQGTGRVVATGYESLVLDTVQFEGEEEAPARDILKSGDYLE